MEESRWQPLRFVIALVIAAVIQGAAGCAAWHARSWRLADLRDPRAADLERRLAAPPVSEDGPFAGRGVRGSDLRPAPTEGADAP